MSENISDWLPGVLCDAQLEHLFKEHVIKGKKPQEFGESSFDLSISKSAWEMKNGCLKPSKENYKQQLQNIKD